MTNSNNQHNVHGHAIDAENIEIDLLDLEKHSKTGKPVPKARRYRLRIDDAFYETEKQELTGAEILALASKSPSDSTLRQRLHGGKVETVAPEQIVRLDTPGLERFIVIPKENTEGENNIVDVNMAIQSTSALRRDFSLPETDTTFLDTNHPNWEAITDNGIPYIILNNFPVPPGYNHSTVKAAIIITSGYPLAALDMVYFFPDLARADGRMINALAPHTICGQQWQRWSRHYGWRHGVDDLTIHVERIKSWLDDELCK